LPVIDFLTGIALSDSNKWVRDSAVWMLGNQPRGSDVAGVLRQVLESDADARVRRSAHQMLRLHDASYRQLTDERAREAQLRKLRPVERDNKV
jgi:hypothetical protein